MQTFEVTEGQQGKNRYFTGSIPVGQLEHMVKFPDELEELDEDRQMQRGLAKTRIKLLVNYLLDFDDHFFSAVTLIILPRELDRPVEEIDPEVEDGDYAFQRLETDRPGRSRFGVLYLSGDVILFPGDGQHRLKAEFEAIKAKPEISREELPVVLVPFESTDQVRQLFSDLNLNAKPVSKTVGYSYETRDPLVLVTKGVIGRVDLFKHRVNKTTNSLPASSKNVVALGTLVPASRSIAEGIAESKEVSLSDYLGKRAVAEKEIAQVWEQIIDAFAAHWSQVLGGDEPMMPGLLREQYVFPHGLGWRGLASATGQLIATHGRANWAPVFEQAVHSLDWHRSADVWEGNAVIHDPESGKNRVNNTGSAVRELTAVVLDSAGAL